MGCHIFSVNPYMCTPLYERSGYMSKKDVATTKYWEDSKRVADLLNVTILRGKRLFLPEDIQVYGNRMFLPNQKKSIEVDRDNVYKVHIQMRATIIATENQSDIHYAMPIRVMSGDSAHYHNQWDKIKKQHGEAKDLKGAEYISGFSKMDKLIPEITLVLYYGEEPWDGPRCLKDLLDLEGLPQELVDSIADYPMHLLEIRKFEDSELFKTDVRLVFGFLQRDSNEDALYAYINQNKTEFQELAEDAFDVICNYSKVKYFIEKKEENRTATGGVNMCKALDDMARHCEERGIERGIQATINICKELGTSMDTVISKVMNHFSFSEEVAHEYVLKYWN